MVPRGLSESEAVVVGASVVMVMVVVVELPLSLGEISVAPSLGKDVRRFRSGRNNSPSR